LRAIERGKFVLDARDSAAWGFFLSSRSSRVSFPQSYLGHSAVPRFLAPSFYLIYFCSSDSKTKLVRNCRKGGDELPAAGNLALETRAHYARTPTHTHTHTRIRLKARIYVRERRSIMRGALPFYGGNTVSSRKYAAS